MHLILFGFKGCGKTYFGKLLAQKLKRTFIDTDRLIEEQERLTCRQITLKIGEEGFRALERKVIQSLSPRSPSIISVGGGSVLDPENYRALAALGKLIYLEADKETLKQRMLKSGVPSFLDPSDVEGSFEKMYQKRKPLYENLQAIKITTVGKKETAILTELIQVVHG